MICLLLLYIVIFSGKFKFSSCIFSSTFFAVCFLLNDHISVNICLMLFFLANLLGAIKAFSALSCDSSFLPQRLRCLGSCGFSLAFFWISSYSSSTYFHVGALNISRSVSFIGWSFSLFCLLSIIACCLLKHSSSITSYLVSNSAILVLDPIGEGLAS